MELELSEYARKRARKLIREVFNGEKHPVEAARELHETVRAKLRELGGGEDHFSREYYNYAIIKGLADALENYRTRSSSSHTSTSSGTTRRKWTHACSQRPWQKLPSSQDWRGSWRS